MAFKPAKFDVSQMSASLPVLPEGLYAAVLTNFSAERKVDDSLESTIGVWEQFDRKSYDPETRTYTKSLGLWELGGRLSYTVELISEKAKEILRKDAPVMMGACNLVFDQASGNLELSANPVIKQILDVCGLGDTEVFQEEIGSVMDSMHPDVYMEVTIPENLKNVPNIEDLLQGAAYNRKRLELIGDYIKGTKVLAVVSLVYPNKPNSFQEDRSADKVNRLNQGPRNAKAGLVSYTEGAEFDLN
jgi:hypothetical protein